MGLWYAMILGGVQGIAEFLPISSSGHLVIVAALLAGFAGRELPQEGAVMNVALHCGTLLAILFVYRSDILELRRNPRLVLLMAVATVPVGAVGLLFKDEIESLFSEPMMAGIALLATAALLLASRSLQRATSDTQTVRLWSALVIGGFQAVAIIPGISRSGSTIAAGLICGLSRTESTRFSFLIAIPAIAGASLVKLRDVITGEDAVTGQWSAIAVGTLVSVVVGVFSLRLLIRIVVGDRLHWFAFYCIAVGGATIVWQLVSG